MSGTLKLGLIIIGVVLLGGFALKLLGSALSIITPFAIVAGIALVIVGLVSRKAIGGGNGRSLP